MFNSFADLCFLQRLSKPCVSLRVGQARISIGIALGAGELRELELRLDGGAGQEAPPDSFGLSCSVHGAPGGIIRLSSISHAFPTVPHLESLCQNPVAHCVHCVLVPSTPSLALCFPPQPVGARPRVPSTESDRGHAAGTPWPGRAPHPVPASSVGPHHPPWLPAPSAMQPRVNICQKKILGDKRARGFSG